MNNSDINRYKEAFLLMNETSSGFIDTTDLHFLIRVLGFTPTERELEKLNKEFIHNQNIDFALFIDILSKLSCAKYSYEQIEQAFQVFDENRYGIINVEKFKQALTTMAEPLTDNEMNEFIRSLEIDEDGFIQYESFCLQFKEKENAISLRNIIREKEELLLDRRL